MPVGEPADLTRRALRILTQAALVVVDDVGNARRLLTHYDLTIPIAVASGQTPLDALETGDVALLATGRSPGLSASSRQLVRAAIERGAPVVPIPGPSLPLTALVISGLPADSFVYLGQLTPASACRDLLAAVAGERRTLLGVASPSQVPALLDVMHEMLMPRPLAVVAASEQGADLLWRGTLGSAPDLSQDPPPAGSWVLVVGGARAGASRWDEARLQDEIRAHLALGLGAKEASRRLAADSGWPRREIYRRAVDAARSETNGEEMSNA